MDQSIWSERRFSPSQKELEKENAEISGATTTIDDWRSPFQHDYDRLLFSTPVRRLSDKTQVWPMDENDGVRTRLTHSHEVANLARSIGSRIAKSDNTIFAQTDLYDVVQPLLSAIGLAHDLGNPPFGHRGEAAIGQWFKDREKWIFTCIEENGAPLDNPISENVRAEFTEFDGNPQTLRLLTKLQTSVAHVGLNLTAASLTATLKYPVGAGNQDKNQDYIKKIGYFTSEQEIVNWARSQTGLNEKQRHPITWIMEACDDIAYSVLDVDDVMKKGIISPDDVLQILRSDASIGRPEVIGAIKEDFDKVEAAHRRTEIARDIKIGYLRARLIGALIKDVSLKFVKNKDSILSFEHTSPLVDGNVLCEKLKNIAKQYAFNNSNVLRMEAIGATAINDLMTAFWNAIIDRKKPDELLSKRKGAKNSYTFSLISQNYIEDALKDFGNEKTENSIRYKELRLLTDMISGMTDSFAMKVWEDLKGVPDVNSA